nr:putative AAA-type ATPase [Megavirus caiporensis]
MSLEKTIMIGALATTSYKLCDQIYDLVKNYLLSFFVNKLQISLEKSPNVFFALKCEIEDLVNDNYLSNVLDRGSNTNFGLNEGCYIINTDSHGRIIVKYTTKQIILYNIVNIFGQDSFILLKNFVKDCKEKYCNTDKMIICHTPNGNNWSFPIVRRPNKFVENNMTNEMHQVLSDIDVFMNSRTTYETRGINYRRGYLIYGPSGCGKTGMIPIIATKYNMEIYVLNFNSPDMSDTTLINLISNVPPRSIIVIEEIDKQIETLRTNNNKYVSIGGILSGLDGPQGLSHGTIIIMTSNCDNFLPPEHMDPLIRPGRIDKKIKFNTKINTSVQDLYV